jgi:hypothetical protein
MRSFATLGCQECIRIGSGNQRLLRDRIRLLQPGEILLHRPRYLCGLLQLNSDPFFSAIWPITPRGADADGGRAASPPLMPVCRRSRPFAMSRIRSA